MGRDMGVGRDMSVVSEKSCYCRRPFKVLVWKKKTRVRNAKGDLVSISRNMTSLRCLDQHVALVPTLHHIQTDYTRQVTYT